MTIYAFSIENFKRSESEVQELMDLARKKFTQLLDHKETVMKNGVHLRFYGNLDLLPEDIRRTIREYSRTIVFRLFLNICVSYTSSDEIQRGLKTILRGHFDVLVKEISAKKPVEKHDLCACTCIYFDSVLWPDYKFWNLFRAIMYYQQHHLYFEVMICRYYD
ncbi:unnamed protein product [Soboliphyme baturini]|uniref:ditrans,polycis-polyprenyl diphosphate synthase [(2E,6E)-farnesyldiphosphate specific] n=1 Tax=Soboliphyme baturini TaxID=241478 RepID=A0A183IIR5_9BILA|nr:unnamed protein product [Soboliphyme baturini]